MFKVWHNVTRIWRVRKSESIQRNNETIFLFNVMHFLMKMWVQKSLLQYQQYNWKHKWFSSTAFAFCLFLITSLLKYIIEDLEIESLILGSWPNKIPDHAKIIRTKFAMAWSLIPTFPFSIWDSRINQFWLNLIIFSDRN